MMNLIALLALSILVLIVLLNKEAFVVGRVTV